MRAGFNLLVLALLGISTLWASASSLGFSGDIHIISVSHSDKKVTFVVYGPCELLLNKPIDSSGSNAQTIKTNLDNAAIVLYRTEKVYPTDESWNDACKFYLKAVGAWGRLQTSEANYVWKDGDLTIISTDHIQLGIGTD